MILFNPTNFNVEFRHAGTVYYFLPKESKDIPDLAAIHALERAHTALVKHTPTYDSMVEISDVEYSKLKWKELTHMASVRKLFVVGTKRAELERILTEYDNQKRGALPQPSAEKEG